MFFKINYLLAIWNGLVSFGGITIPFLGVYRDTRVNNQGERPGASAERKAKTLKMLLTLALTAAVSGGIALAFVIPKLHHGCNDCKSSSLDAPHHKLTKFRRLGGSLTARRIYPLNYIYPNIVPDSNDKFSFR